MAIEKRFIHFKTFSKFKEKLESGNILDTSIVFLSKTLDKYTLTASSMTMMEYLEKTMDHLKTTLNLSPEIVLKLL